MSTEWPELPHRSATLLHAAHMNKVLSSFYVLAACPIVDYAPVALIANKPKLREKLETVQNEAARIILGAPR